MKLVFQNYRGFFFLSLLVIDNAVRDNLFTLTCVDKKYEHVTIDHDYPSKYPREIFYSLKKKNLKKNKNKYFLFNIYQE